MDFAAWCGSWLGVAGSRVPRLPHPHAVAATARGGAPDELPVREPAADGSEPATWSSLLQELRRGQASRMSGFLEVLLAERPAGSCVRQGERLEHGPGVCANSDKRGAGARWPTNFGEYLCFTLPMTAFWHYLVVLPLICIWRVPRSQPQPASPRCLRSSPSSKVHGERPTHGRVLVLAFDLNTCLLI